jgi:hypothetical protein
VPRKRAGVIKVGRMPHQDPLPAVDVQRSLTGVAKDHTEILPHEMVRKTAKLTYPQSASIK